MRLLDGSSARTKRPPCIEPEIAHESLGEVTNCWYASFVRTEIPSAYHRFVAGRKTLRQQHVSVERVEDMLPRPRRIGISQERLNSGLGRRTRSGIRRSSAQSPRPCRYRRERCITKGNLVQLFSRRRASRVLRTPYWRCRDRLPRAYRPRERPGRDRRSHIPCRS